MSLRTNILLPLECRPPAHKLVKSRVLGQRCSSKRFAISSKLSPDCDIGCKLLPRYHFLRLASSSVASWTLLVDRPAFASLEPMELSELATVLPLDYYVASLKTAREEIVALRTKIELNSRLGTSPDFRVLSKQLRSGELGNMERTVEGADQYIGEAPLEIWEEEVWDSIGNDTVAAQSDR
ncbi:hypothetical protein CYMTET_31243, partial [Cymbomonas tetramitiformis]